MSEELKAVTWRTEADKRRYLRHQKIVNANFAIKLWWHCIYWRTLHALGIGRTYSKAMCRMNWYRKFPDGRCMWCGKKHDPRQVPETIGGDG